MVPLLYATRYEILPSVSLNSMMLCFLSSLFIVYDQREPTLHSHSDGGRFSIIYAYLASYPQILVFFILLKLRYYLMKF